MNNKFNLIGLSYRAKKLLIGYDDTIKNLKKVQLVIVSNDLSLGTLEKIKEKCDNKIEIITIGSSLDLSHSLGLNNVKIVSITDSGFKEAILKSL